MIRKDARLGAFLVPCHILGFDVLLFSCWAVAQISKQSMFIEGLKVLRLTQVDVKFSKKQFQVPTLMVASCRCIVAS